MSLTLSGYLAVLFLHKFSRGLGCGLCVFVGLRLTGGPVQSTFTFAVVPENVEQMCLCRFHKVLNRADITGSANTNKGFETSYGRDNSSSESCWTTLHMCGRQKL